MNYRIAYKRAIHIGASGLAMAAQRLPFLKSLTPFLGSSGIKFAAPVTVTFLGTHALSGQSVTIVPLNGASDRESIAVGEQFVWSFNVSLHTLRDASANTDEVLETLPPGLEFFGPQAGVMTLGGIPTVAGEYEIVLFAYRFTNRLRGTTAPYTLTLTVEGGPSPFESFLDNFFTEAERANPTVSGPNADPDLDGIDNAMEYVLDLDPKKSNSMLGTIAPDPADPQIIRYSIPLNALATDALVEFEESTTLAGNWQTVPPDLVERTEDMITLAAPMDGKRFYRLRVIIEE